MAKVCPQRIIKEAIRLLEHADYGYMHSRREELLEARDNNLLELASLEKALHRDGIINIEEFSGG